MGEAAAASEGINPNVPVTGEGKSESKANSDVSWDDVAEVTQPRGGKKAKESAKPAARAKSGGAFDEADDSDGDAKEEADKAADRGEDGDDDKDKKEPKKDDGKDHKEAPKKAKILKFKAGDSEHDISGDAVVTIPLDGKKEEVKLQDLVNNYNGKVAWDKRFTELDKSEKAHKSSMGEMTKMVSDLHEKAQKDPETAWDFLADWTKQDPVALKEKILRQHIQEILPLARLSKEQLEAWIGDRKRDWRDRAHTSRENQAKASEQTQKIKAEREDSQKRYGIDDKSFEDAREKLTRYLSHKDSKFDPKSLTPMNVVHAHRNLMALDVIQEAVPHLAKHKDFDSIVGDITSDLVKHPSMTREKLATLLKDVYGDDDSRLRNLGRRAAKTADVSEGDRRGANAPKSRSRSEAVTFDDLD